MDTIHESFTTEVKYVADVLVVGGGFAGIAAALAAARQGKKVLLAERMYALGGLGTLGIVTIYLPIDDGYGRQVSFGLADELARLCTKGTPYTTRGYKNWILGEGTRGENDSRFELDFNPQTYMILAEKLLLENGVQILYGTSAVAAACDGDKIDAVVFENKSGRFAIRAKSFVDASGDADLTRIANVPSAQYGRGNVLAAWYYECGKEGYKLHMLGFCDVPGKEVPKLIERRFAGIEAQELSDVMICSHAAILSDIEQKKAEDATVEPATIPTIPQVRMTRRVDGAYTLDESEVHKRFDDSVGLICDWRKRGPVFELPFGTLYSPKMRNLAFAGRCISVTDDMWDITRVIPVCAVTGEAAGIASAMTDDFAHIDIAELQNRLRKNGVKIHEEELS